jgi:hypothetical protein
MGTTIHPAEVTDASSTLEIADTGDLAVGFASPRGGA